MGNSVKPFREESWTIKTTRTTKRKVIRQRPAGKLLAEARIDEGAAFDRFRIIENEIARSVCMCILPDESKTECLFAVFVSIFLGIGIEKFVKSIKIYAISYIEAWQIPCRSRNSSKLSQTYGNGQNKSEQMIYIIM